MFSCCRDTSLKLHHFAYVNDRLKFLIEVYVHFYMIFRFRTFRECKLGKRYDGSIQWSTRFSSSQSSLIEDSLLFLPLLHSCPSLSRTERSMIVRQYATASSPNAENSASVNTYRIMLSSSKDRIETDQKTRHSSYGDDCIELHINML